MKKIEDYLKYYIGHECETPDGRGTLTSVGDPMNLEDCVVAGFINDEESGFNGDPIDYAVDHKFIKPILRPLSDMTEEEAIEVYRITDIRIYPNDPDQYDVTYLKNNEGKLYAIQVVNLRDLGVYLNIDADSGDALKYVHDGNADPKIEARLRNQHEYTHYMLSRGFDLFDLITSGLAITSKTERE